MEWTAAQIRNRRIDRGLTQAQLAAALRVSTSVVTKWENGQREPRGSSIRGLERTLGDQPAPDAGDLAGKTDVELAAILQGIVAELTRRLAKADGPPHVALPPQPLRIPRTIDLHRREEHGADSDESNG